ncbi:MAG: MaoC family dehydratase N-terminal domain-containing protein [Desulfobacterales bacterium]|nr:MAG: MaoC family dehydratase N-terminal domain-containing protein [Desulfobacterales bacterium]
MPEVDLSVIGTKTEPIVFEYTWKDIVLYNIGVGAGDKDLAFVYENAPGGLKVLPSFCVVPAMKAFPRLGDNLEWSRMLHGEQVIRLLRPLAPEGKIVQVGEVLNIYDKGKGAVYRVRIKGRTEGDKDLYEAEWSIFYLGAGGFGGDPGPKAEKIVPPEGIRPDFSISEKVAENQAIIYRLSGDYNPLHLDPAAAKRGGFDRPILHGLCTYGFATRAIVNELLGGEVARLKEFSARFSDVVYPGDILTTEGWKSGDGYIIQARTEKSIVLSNARVVIE